MRELLTEYDRLKDAGPVGRAVVTEVWGSAPRPEGSNLLAGPGHVMAGSVSGGCVENAVVEEIIQSIETGRPKTLQYGVTHERAWEFGLSCGGTISLLVEPSVRPELLAAARNPEASVVATIVGGNGPIGAAVVAHESEPPVNHGVPEALVGPITEAATKALSRVASYSGEIESAGGSVRVLYEVFARRPTLLIFGGVHVATALVKLAKPLGFRIVVADGREAFLTTDRFPDADLLISGWPAEVFDQVGIDNATCICILTHDPKFDEPAIDIALRSNAAYVGVIGSRKTQSLRRERLVKAGYTPEEIGRLHGPIGLDLGGRDPAEIALSILAEITATRHDGRVLRAKGGSDAK